jgi:hypothetical protein
MRGYSTQLKSSPHTVRRRILSMCVMHLSVIVLRPVVPDTVDTPTEAANSIRPALEWNATVLYTESHRIQRGLPSYLIYSMVFLPRGSTVRFPTGTWNIIICYAQTGWEPTQPFVQWVPRVFPHLMPWLRISGALLSLPPSASMELLGTSLPLPLFSFI